LNFDLNLTHTLIALWQLYSMQILSCLDGLQLYLLAYLIVYIHRIYSRISQKI